MTYFSVKMNVINIMPHFKHVFLIYFSVAELVKIYLYSFNEKKKSKYIRNMQKKEIMNLQVMVHNWSYFTCSQSYFY